MQTSVVEGVSWSPSVASYYHLLHHRGCRLRRRQTLHAGRFVRAQVTAVRLRDLHECDSGCWRYLRTLNIAQSESVMKKRRIDAIEVRPKRSKKLYEAPSAHGGLVSYTLLNNSR